jgi:hypothetical protein
VTIRANEILNPADEVVGEEDVGVGAEQDGANLGLERALLLGTALCLAQFEETMARGDVPVQVAGQGSAVDPQRERMNPGLALGGRQGVTLRVKVLLQVVGDDGHELNVAGEVAAAQLIDGPLQGALDVKASPVRRRHALPDPLRHEIADGGDQGDAQTLLGRSEV